MKLLFITLMVTFSACVFAQTGTVQVTVTGIKQDKGGIISAGIFIEKNFPKDNQQQIGKKVKVKGDQAVIIFKDVPIGKYAMAVYQDVDSNNKLRTNLIGLPLEPIGFSNNVRINFGPPSFNSASFLVKKNQELFLNIKLR